MRLISIYYSAVIWKPCKNGVFKLICKANYKKFTTKWILISWAKSGKNELIWASLGTSTLIICRSPGRWDFLLFHH